MSALDLHMREAVLIIGMDIMIPAVAGRGGVAAATLECEGLFHYVVPVDEDERGQQSPSYGEWLAKFWRRGSSFILLEDDIAPWPGALANLADCEEPWCAYDYLVGRGHFGGWRGLGCVKFGAELMRAHPTLCDGWIGEHWRSLDAAVFSALCGVTGSRGPHEHEPPVAHAKHLRGGSWL